MTSSSLVRHWLSGFAVIAASAMVILGQSVFAGQLQGYDYIFYWSVCMVLTALAAFAAIYEMSTIRRESRRQQNELLEETFGENVEG
jgi:integral membrane sensor domain MASE1